MAYAMTAGLLGIAALGACQESGDNGEDSGSSVAAADCVDRATKLADDASAKIGLGGPSDKLDGAQLAGKSVWLLEPAPAPYWAEVERGFKAAAKALDMKLNIVNAQGQLPNMVRGIDQAVASGADGIVLGAWDPASVANQVKAAEEAGIPVLLAMQFDPGSTKAEGIAQHTSVSFVRMGEVIAAEMLRATSCDLNVVAPFPAGATNVGTMKDQTASTIEDLCGDACTYKASEFPLAQTATALGPLAVSKLNADPSANYVQATFSSAGPLIEASMQQASLDVPIAGTGGGDPDLNSLSTGGLMKANVIYAPGEYTGWVLVDGIARLVSGEQIDDKEIPVRLVTAESAADGITPANLWDGFGTFPAEFTKAWGLN